MKGYALLESCDEARSAASGASAARAYPDRPDGTPAHLAVSTVSKAIPSTPSWAAAICRHRDERRRGTEAPLFSTPLWEPVVPAVDEGNRPSPAKEPRELEPPESAPLGLEKAALQVPANPFAVPPVDRGSDKTPRGGINGAVDTGATGATGAPCFVSPHGRPKERSKSPRLRALPTPWIKQEVEGAFAPCSPQVQPRIIPGRVEPAALRPEVAVVPKVESPEEFSSSAAEWEVDHSELQLEELLGTGSTAEVYRAGWHGTDVAVKKLRSTGQLSTEFKREISVLLRLRHPNLVLFMGACTKAPQALIISEFCAGGTIFALLHQRKDLQLPWGQRLQVALDVAKGMNFLHRRQVVHRDLKSLNLLLTAPLRSNEDIPAVKVSDFGLSRAFPSAPQQVCMTSGAGTYHWMAPEVLSGQSYDEKVDVYSYGICLYELITRRIPYDTSGLEPVSIAVAVSRGKRPDPKVVPQDCPADLRFTMKCCWAHRPSGRPGFDTILETLKLVKGCRSQQNL